MRVEVRPIELQALLHSRILLSPGGAATRIRRSRVRVMQLIDEPKERGGLLAWCAPRRPGRLGRTSPGYLYVDLGPDPRDGHVGLLTVGDPYHWYNEDPEEIVSQAMVEYRDYVASEASGE